MIEREMMTTTPSLSSALMQALADAESALSRGDADSANHAMASAADLCRTMQNAGQTIPASELAPFQDLAERCRSSLERLGTALNAESFRDDNHRRGVLSYHSTMTGTREA